MKSDFVRFMGMVQIPAETGECWLWTGSRPDGRYGHFTADGCTVKAHRWLFKTIGRPLSDAVVLRHRCDNPGCVNPDHLVAGTSAENTADMFSRGRNPDRRGEKHPLVRLTAEQVLEIRKLKACGHTEVAIAAKFGVGRGQVGKIARRENWRHI